MGRYDSADILNGVYDPTVGGLRTTSAGSVRQKIIDEAISGTTYIGSAPAGQSTSETGWLLTKMVESGTTTTITHANGTWDNRTSATYS